MVWASILAMTALSLWSLSYRYRVEASNKAVGLLMEAQVVNDLAAITGKSLTSLLETLKDSGLTGVAITEESIGDLIDQDELTVSRGSGGSVVLTGEPATLARVARGIGRRGGLSSPPAFVGGSLQFSGDVRALRTTSAGLDPYDAACAQQAGLVVVARCANVLGAGPSYIHDLLDECKSLGATAFLAAGDQVLGQRESLEDTSSSLEVLDMQYLAPEFAKIAGDARMASLIPERTIRLHSMQQPEVDKATPAAIVDRFKLAFRERNIRWLLTRPVSLGGPDPVRTVGQSLSSIRSGVLSEGGAVKPPRPFHDPGVPSWLFPLIAVSAVPWLVFAATNFVRSRFLQVAATLGILVVAVAAVFEQYRPFSALMIGLGGPVVAYCLWLTAEKPWSAAKSYLLVTLVSLSAGLAIAGLLNGLPYLVQVKQVLGVKAILIGPVVLVGWLLLSRFWSPRDLMQGPVKWGQILLGLGVGVAVLLLLMRSGNDAPGAVSDLELKFRALLDRLMYARPRTKEILLGHPALIIGLLLHDMSRRNQRLLPHAVIFLTLGAVGQSDIVDTLCHTHTPLDIGLARVAVGFILGGIIGVLAWLPIRALARRFEGS